MVGTIVVPLDGSQLAERALGYASSISERVGSPLLLIRVLDREANEADKTTARNYLRTVEESVSGRVQIVVEQGRPAEEIVEIAKVAGDPLIVMSTHGRGGIQRWMTGSVADEVVRSAGCPVLLVRGDKELPRTAQVSNILVPVDGSTYAESAVEHAVYLAKAFGGRIHLLRVVDTPSAYAMLSRHMETAATGDVLQEIVQSMRKEATEYVESLADTIRQQGIEVREVVLEGYPGEQLIEHERRGFFQLVVMATAGRSGMSRVVFGSVAERVLKLGRSPVMMIRPQVANQAGAVDPAAGA